MKERVMRILPLAFVLTAVASIDRTEPDVEPAPTSTTTTTINHDGSRRITTNHAQPRSTTVTIVTSVAPSSTTTTEPPRTPPSSVESCPQWFELATDVGWPDEALERLGYIIWRESRCDPDAYNGADPAGGSRGLIQINGFWCRSTSGWPDGFVQTEAGLEVCDDLYDPRQNLAAGLAIYRYGLERHDCGWGPWTTRNTDWC